MVKNVLFLFLILATLSCAKKGSSDSLNEQNYVELQYDTTAIDSFSKGAISVDVAEQIRKSSVAFQDSLRKAEIAADIAKKELADQEKMEKEIKEKEGKEKIKGAQKETEPNKAKEKTE